MRRLTRTDQCLIIAFVALMILPVLYRIRSLDDNTLTSWNWVFPAASMPRTFGFTVLGLIAAFFLARAAQDERGNVPLLFFLSWAAVVPLWNEPEVILDASRYFLQAKHLELYGIASFFREWGGELGAWTDLPVVPFLYGLIFRYLGESRMAAQLFNTFLFSLAVISTYRIGRALWDRETGFLAGVLLLGFPYLLIQAPLMLVDVPAMFLVTLSMDAFLCAVEKGGLRRFLPAVVVLPLALFTKYSTWFMLPVLAVIAFVAVKREGRAALKRSALLLTAAGVLAAGVFLASHAVFLHQIDLLRVYQWPGLERWKESFASTFLFQIHPFVTVLALFGIVAAVRKRDIRFLIPAWFVLFVLLLQVGRVRYLLPLFPLLALMAAYGLSALTDDGEVRRFTALSAAAASLALVFCAYLPFLNSTTMANLRVAGRYLDTLPGQAVEVRVQPQNVSAGNTEMAIPLLDLFTRKRIVYRREPVPRPDERRIRISPLRFTWEFTRPAFYSGGSDDNDLAVVVISAHAPPRSLNGNTSTRSSFAADTETFRYKTSVTVLSPNRLAGTAQ